MFFRDLPESHKFGSVPVGNLSITLLHMEVLQGAELYSRVGKLVYPVLPQSREEMEWQGDITLFMQKL